MLWCWSTDSRHSKKNWFEVLTAGIYLNASLRLDVKQFILDAVWKPPLKPSSYISAEWRDRCDLSLPSTTSTHTHLSTSSLTMPHYQADFTTEQEGPSTCDRCKQTFTTGTKLHYMQDLKHPNKPGHSLCDSCHDHYLSKPTIQLVDGLSFYWCQLVGWWYSARFQRAKG